MPHTRARGVFIKRFARIIWLLRMPLHMWHIRFYLQAPTFQWTALLGISLCLRCVALHCSAERCPGAAIRMHGIFIYACDLSLMWKNGLWFRLGRHRFNHAKQWSVSVQCQFRENCMWIGWCSVLCLPFYPQIDWSIHPKVQRSTASHRNQITQQKKKNNKNYNLFFCDDINWSVI